MSQEGQCVMLGLVWVAVAVLFFAIGAESKFTLLVIAVGNMWLVGGRICRAIERK